jgi:hypothetical protein
MTTATNSGAPAPAQLRLRPYSKAEMIARGAGGYLSSGYERYIPLDRIDGLEPVPANNESDDGEYHAGRPITDPIEVQYDADLDLYMLFAGNHRFAQARANMDTHIIAFIEPARQCGRNLIGDYARRTAPPVELAAHCDPEYTRSAAGSPSF